MPRKIKASKKVKALKAQKSLEAKKLQLKEHKRTISKGIFNEAIRGESFGAHPGYADLRIEFSVYNPITQTREKLPGKSLELLVSNINEVDDMIKVMEISLRDWVNGLLLVTKE